MKKMVNIEQLFCDNCNIRSGFTYVCVCCGKEYCFDCHRNYGVLFKCGVYHSGSEDGFFCNTCLAKPPSKYVPLLNAYLKIKVRRDCITIAYHEKEAEDKKAEENLVTAKKALGIKE